MHYIYLHGFLSGANSYKGSYLRERFAEAGLTLHTPDLNGGDFERLTLTGQLQIIGELAESLPGELTLLGSSMGGYLAALFAEENQRVKQMALIAPAFQFATRYLARMDKTMLQRWREEGYLQVYHHAYREHRRLHYHILEDARAYDRMKLQRQLPTLILQGVNDESVDYRLSVKYLQTHPSARLLLLNADHQMIGEVETIWEYTRRFLRI